MEPVPMRSLLMVRVGQARPPDPELIRVEAVILANAYSVLRCAPGSDQVQLRDTNTRS